jgi:hypothetical protein
MSKKIPWGVQFIGDAVLWKLGKGRCCITRDGRLSAASEIKAMFLGKDGKWHWPKGPVYEDEIEARRILESASAIAMVSF